MKLKQLERRYLRNQQKHYRNPNYREGTHPMCKTRTLRKSLYGLKQSPRA